MTPPLLTITTPTWNRSGYLNDALESITSQAVALGVADRIEVLIADNCSDDETPVVARKHMDANVVRVRYHRHERNLGPLPNFLFCLANAGGRFLHLLGDDDLLAPGGLEAVWHTLESHGDAPVFVFRNIPDTGDYRVTETLRVTAVEAVQRAYYHMGNAGVFVVRSDLARLVVEQCGPAHPWTCWLQTEIMLRAAVLSGDPLPFVLSPLISSSSPHHGPNTRYTAYYLWETTMVGLVKTALNMRSQVGPEVFDAAINHLSAPGYVRMRFWNLARLLATSDTPAERKAYQELTAWTRSLNLQGLNRWFRLADRLGHIPRPLLSAFVRTVRFARRLAKRGNTSQEPRGQQGRAYTSEDFGSGGSH